MKCDDSVLSETFRVHIPERPTFSLLRSKAGVIGRPIGETGGTVMDQVAAQAGVIRVSNGFRCPDDMTNGGTFTDAMGTTCGVRVVMAAVEDVLEGVRDAATGTLHTEGRDGGKGAAILVKNEGILGAIADAGGHVFAPSEEMVKANEGKTVLFGVRTPKQAYENQKKYATFVIDEMREYLSTGKRRQPNPSDGSVVTEWREIDRLHPDVRKLLAEASDEELLSIMQDTAVKFHEGVSKNIRVSIPSGLRLDSFLDDGVYKTTHDVGSDHSNAYIRSDYELQIGLPRDLPNELRPASGYVTHPDWDEANVEKFNSVNDVEVNEFSDLPREAYGAVYCYGNVDLILRPETSGRAGYGQGDSISTMLLPTRFDETDPEKVFTAIASAGGKERSMDRQILALLEAHRTGSFKYFNSLEVANPEGEEHLHRAYFEALIPGSFGIEDVAAVRINYAQLASRTVDPESRFNGQDALEQTKKIRDEFFSTEKLQQMGFSDEEIQYLLGMLDNYKTYDKNSLSIPRDLMIHQLTQLLDFRVAKERKAKIEAKGVEVQVTHSKSVDPFDPKSYGGQPGDDVEAILLGRFMTAFPKQIRADRERRERMAREQAERIARGEPEPFYG